jgi:hypothetical protein
MIRILFFILFISCGLVSKAQQSVQSKDSTSIQIKPKKIQPKPEPIMDTNESLKYMSGLLLFEVKKRLNLTNAEEEQKAIEAKSKKVRLSIGGIVIER